MEGRGGGGEGGGLPSPEIFDLVRNLSGLLGICVVQQLFMINVF